MRMPLLALLANGPAHGYELKQALEQRFGSVLPPLNAGQIYTTLSRLERDGLVDDDAVAQNGRPNKRVYRLTGEGQAELARWVQENDSRLPIVAFMAGKFMDEMPGMSFGHAGTIVEGKEDTATEKIARLAAAGITVAEEISQIPDLMKAKLAERSPA